MLSLQPGFELLDREVQFPHSQLLQFPLQILHRLKQFPLLHQNLNLLLPQPSNPRIRETETLIIMGAICPSICGEGVVPPTRCAQISVIGLQIMNVFQLIILISAFVTGDSTNGIISVIFVLVLFCAWRFLQYRIVVIYVLYCMFLFIMSLVWLLTIAQNKKKLFTSGMDSAKAAFQLIYCVYYFIVSIICFFIYREFKAISFEKNPAILKYFQDRNNSMNDNANESGNIGEDNRFAPDYGEMQPRERNVNRVQENRQVTQVFAGKGVMIGGN